MHFNLLLNLINLLQVRLFSLQMKEQPIRMTMKQMFTFNYSLLKLVIALKFPAIFGSVMITLEFCNGNHLLLSIWIHINVKYFCFADNCSGHELHSNSSAISNLSPKLTNATLAWRSNFKQSKKMPLRNRNWVIERELNEEHLSYLFHRFAIPRCDSVWHNICFQLSINPISDQRLYPKNSNKLKCISYANEHNAFSFSFNTIIFI